jgi:hypothetical protein
MTRSRSSLAFACVGLCLSLFVIIVSGRQIETLGSGKANKPVKKLIHLEAGAIEPKANGIAKILSKTKGKAKQDFMVVGSNLKESATYTLFVDGVEIESAVAEPEQGEGKGAGAVVFHYSNKAKPGNDEGIQPLPAELDPITDIRVVEIRDEGGAVVLSGEFPA